MQRAGSSLEVAQAIVWLLSEDSSYTTRGPCWLWRAAGRRAFYGEQPMNIGALSSCPDCFFGNAILRRFEFQLAPKLMRFWAMDRYPSPALRDRNRLEERTSPSTAKISPCSTPYLLSTSSTVVPLIEEPSSIKSNATVSLNDRAKDDCLVTNEPKKSSIKQFSQCTTLTQSSKFSSKIRTDDSILSNVGPTYSETFLIFT